MNVFRKFYHFVRLREAMRMADKAHASSGNRFYVMPAADGKLLVLDRDNFRILRRKHYINQNVSVHDLIAECFYFTPYRNGMGAITPDLLKFKRSQYFSWVETVRKLAKPAKKKGGTK